MLKFKPVIEKVIEKLGIVKDELMNDLSDPELEQFRLRVGNSFDTMSRALSVATGGQIDKLGENGSTFQPKPLKKLLDMDVDETVKTTDEAVNPRKEEIERIKQEVTDAYEGFLDRDSAEIIDSVEELIIRGVAKRAGMSVDANTPEKITVPFIDEIKEAIIVQRENGDVVNNTDLSADQMELIEQLLGEAIDTYNNRATAYEYDQMTEAKGLELRERMTDVSKVGDDPREVLQQFIDSLPELMPERNVQQNDDEINAEIDRRIEEGILGEIPKAELTTQLATDYERKESEIDVLISQKVQSMIAEGKDIPNGVANGYIEENELTDDQILDMNRRTEEAVQSRPKDELIDELSTDYPHVNRDVIVGIIDKKVTELLESGVEIPNALELGYITDDQLGEPFVDDGTLTKAQIVDQLMSIQLTDNASEDERHRLKDLHELGEAKLKRLNRDELIEHLTFFLNN